MKKYTYSGDAEDGLIATTIRELAVLRMSDHPNVITMLWYDNDKFKYMTTPVYSYDLVRFMAQHKSLAMIDVKNISYQILRGLYYLHTHGISHRDVKPANILIQPENNNYKVVLIDLGMARRLDPLDQNGTKTHDICTMWYRAPELMLGGDKGSYSFKIDAWSVGCVIAELYSGQVLLRGDSDINQLYKIFRLRGTPTEEMWEGVSGLARYKDYFPVWNPTFSKRTKNWDPVVKDLVDKMLTMDPAKRIDIYKAIQHQLFSDIPAHILKTYTDNDLIPIKTKTIDNYTLANVPELHVSLSNQDQIKEFMRIILLDWLMEVCYEYGVSASVYIRAQGILDRFTQKCSTMEQQNYQLVGIAVFWLGSKIEDVYHIAGKHLIYISDNIYTHEQLSDMEKEIMRTLDLDVYFPVSWDFITTYASRCPLTDYQVSEVKFILTYITYNLELMKYHPSILCLCACLYVSDNMDYTDIDECDEISDCMVELKEWLGQSWSENKIKFKSNCKLDGLKTYFEQPKYNLNLSKYI